MQRSTRLTLFPGVCFGLPWSLPDLARVNGRNSIFGVAFGEIAPSAPLVTQGNDPKCGLSPGV